MIYRNNWHKLSLISIYLSVVPSNFLKPDFFVSQRFLKFLDYVFTNQVVDILLSPNLHMNISLKMNILSYRTYGQFSASSSFCVLDIAVFYVRDRSFLIFLQYFRCLGPRVLKPKMKENCSIMLISEYGVHVFATKFRVTKFRVTKCPVTRCPVTKHPVTKYPVTKCPVTKCPVTKCPVTKCPCDKKSCDKMSVWRNDLMTKCSMTKGLSDKMSILCDEMSMWQNDCDKMTCDERSCDKTSAAQERAVGQEFGSDVVGWPSFMM